MKWMAGLDSDLGKLWWGCFWPEDRLNRACSDAEQAKAGQLRGYYWAASLNLGCSCPVQGLSLEYRKFMGYGLAYLRFGLVAEQIGKALAGIRLALLLTVAIWLWGFIEGWRQLIHGSGWV